MILFFIYSPKIVDNTNRKCIEDAISYAILIILELMKDDVSTSYLNTLEKIFDTNNKYYMGNYIYCYLNLISQAKFIY
jgi:hypothetical protein